MGCLFIVAHDLLGCMLVTLNLRNGPTSMSEQLSGLPALDAAALSATRPSRATVDALLAQVRDRDATIARLSHELNKANTQVAKVRGIWRSLGDALMDTGP